MSRTTSASGRPPFVQLDRRGFLGLALGGLVVAACGSSSGGAGADDAGADAGADAGTDAGANDAFSIWTNLRTAVRASPDHLPQAAARAVATKDPKAILAFVQTQIATLPPPTWNGVVTGVRWGTRATLRGGAGTPREKAELLVELLAQAGFASTVVSGLVGTAKPLTAMALFAQPVSRSFDPDASLETLQGWAATLGEATPTPIDPTGTELAAMVAQITGALPANLGATTAAPTDPSKISLLQIPVVSIQVAGQTLLANPVVAGSLLGDPGVDSTSAAPPADAPLPVVVELLGVTARAPKTPVSLAKRAFAASDVVGRQLVVGFAPQLDLATLAVRRVRDIQAYTSIIRVQGPDVDDAARKSLQVVGGTVTLQGDLVVVAPDGTATFNGTQTASAPPDPAADARVASLSVRVQSAGFPAIALSLTALDASGHVVEGLGASSFRIVEDATPAGAVMTKTPSQPLRVALVIDADDPLDSGETMAQLAAKLTSAIVSQFPGASIIVGGGDMSTYGDLTDPAKVVAEVGGGDADDFWQTLSAANRHAPAVIVCAGDFISTAGGGPFRADVARGVPVIAVSAGLSADAAAMQDVATLSGGKALPGAGIQAVIDATKAALNARTQARPYELRYGAALVGNATRKVTVSMAGKSVTTSATYDAPAAAAQLEPPGWIALHLSVSVGDQTVRRTLAGLSTTELPDPGTAVSQAVLDDVRGALLSTTVLSFEGTAAPLSVWLDDILTAKIDAKPLWDAIGAHDAAKVQAALSAPQTLLPGALAMLQLPPIAQADGHAATFETGLRVIGYSVRAKFGVGVVRQVDAYPLTGWATLAADAQTSFATTLKRTARLSVVESHTFADSAATRLAGKALKALPPGPLYAADVAFLDPSVVGSMLDAFNEYGACYRLVPPVAIPNAFWAVDASTGTVLGVLPDGAGGAAAQADCKNLKDTEAALNLLSFMGLGGPYFILGLAVARVVTAVAIVFDNMEDPSFTYDPNQFVNSLATGLACEAVKGAAGDSLSAASSIGLAAAKADAATAGARGGNGILNCPSGNGPLNC